MEQPAQRQPVDRQYMRLVVGRGSRPPPRAGEPSESNASRQRRGRGRTSAEGSEGSPRAENYLLELTTFRSRSNRW